MFKNSLLKQIRKTYQLAGPHAGNEVLKNAASLSSLQMFSYLLPLLVLPYIFQIIGADKFGLLAFAQAFTQIFVIFTDYGFSITATKDISLCRNQHAKINAVYASVMTIKTVFLIISALLCLVVIVTIPKFQQDWLLYTLSFGMVIGQSFFPGWFFQGMERMGFIAAIHIIGELIYAISVFYFVRTTGDFLLIPIFSSAMALGTALIGQWIAWRKFNIRLSWPHISIIRQHLHRGAHVFFSIVAVNAYTTTRVLALGLLTNNTLTGFYSLAEKLAGIVQSFPLWSFSQAIFPRLSKIYKKNKIKAFTLMCAIQKITLIIALMVFPLVLILAPWIIGLISDTAKNAVLAPFNLLLLAVFVVSANAFRVQFLLVAGQTHRYYQIHLTGALCGLPLIIMFIHIYSYQGAALATIAIETIIFLLTSYHVQQAVGKNLKRLRN